MPNFYLLPSKVNNLGLSIVCCTGRYAPWHKLTETTQRADITCDVGGLHIPAAKTIKILMIWPRTPLSLAFHNFVRLANFSLALKQSRFAVLSALMWPRSHPITQPCRSRLGSCASTPQPVLHSALPVDTRKRGLAPRWLMLAGVTLPFLALTLLYSLEEEVHLAV